MVERVNGTLESILRKIILENPSQLSTLVQTAGFAYIIGYHSLTEYSLFQLLYGRHPSLPPLLYQLVKDSKKVL